MRDLCKLVLVSAAMLVLVTTFASDPAVGAPVVDVATTQAPATTDIHPITTLTPATTEVSTTTDLSEDISKDNEHDNNILTGANLVVTEAPEETTPSPTTVTPVHTTVTPAHTTVHPVHTTISHSTTEAIIKQANLIVTEAPTKSIPSTKTDVTKKPLTQTDNTSNSVKAISLKHEDEKKHSTKKLKRKIKKIPMPEALRLSKRPIKMHKDSKKDNMIHVHVHLDQHEDHFPFMFQPSPYYRHGFMPQLRQMRPKKHLMRPPRYHHMEFDPEVEHSRYFAEPTYEHPTLLMPTKLEVSADDETNDTENNNNNTINQAAAQVTNDDDNNNKNTNKLSPGKFEILLQEMNGLLRCEYLQRTGCSENLSKIKKNLPVFASLFGKFKKDVKQTSQVTATRMLPKSDEPKETTHQSGSSKIKAIHFKDTPSAHDADVITGKLEISHHDYEYPRYISAYAKNPDVSKRPTFSKLPKRDYSNLKDYRYKASHSVAPKKPVTKKPVGNAEVYMPNKPYVKSELSNYAPKPYSYLPKQPNYKFASYDRRVPYYAQPSAHYLPKYYNQPHYYQWMARPYGPGYFKLRNLWFNPKLFDNKKPFAYGAPSTSQYRGNKQQKQQQQQQHQQHQQPIRYHSIEEEEEEPAVEIHYAAPEPFQMTDKHGDQVALSPVHENH